MMAQFDIESRCNGSVNDIRVIGSPYSVIWPDVLVIPDDEIEIEFDYPMNTRARFSFVNHGGFTRREVFECIKDGYNAIYAEPSRYGIWGHGIIDLCVEGCEYDSGVLKLTMGS
jgi:hypothetical protein